MGSVIEYNGKKYRRGACLEGKGPYADGRLFIWAPHDGGGQVLQDTDNIPYNKKHFEAIEVKEPITEITKTIKAPEGYEFESDVKRAPKQGDFYLGERDAEGAVMKANAHDSEHVSGEVEYMFESWNLPSSPRYILRKIKKEPRRLWALYYEDGQVRSVCGNKKEAERLSAGTRYELVELIEKTNE